MLISSLYHFTSVSEHVILVPPLLPPVRPSGLQPGWREADGRPGGGAAATPSVPHEGLVVAQ